MDSPGELNRISVTNDSFPPKFIVIFWVFLWTKPNFCDRNVIRQEYASSWNVRASCENSAQKLLFSTVFYLPSLERNFLLSLVDPRTIAISLNLNTISCKVALVFKRWVFWKWGRVFRASQKNRSVFHVCWRCQVLQIEFHCSIFRVSSLRDSFNVDFFIYQTKFVDIFHCRSRVMTSGCASPW